MSVHSVHSVSSDGESAPSAPTTPAGVLARIKTYFKDLNHVVKAKNQPDRVAGYSPHINNILRPARYYIII